ncbi:competence/damage-inducible protein A [Candidatus Methylopumilus planktonicus]|jgi:molybdopterin-biosynthesis enzyme MoeA-like protein|uniref:competence/damage-inducible protein A n=1 Tax=Candidatus Methylopumilus planktonicus TaxID=1581557 RepID=UPI0011229759|nr:molybdopterin-binding protein [Candidatus Methylopumilus planktonicus]QDD10482.1 competence/damage-inducible protein A [Candidatus Methylopumilus planktonicus]QDD22952.1 competence/damage-inducible protein A [Candidatus Methylopumilus planktonicus]
MEFGTLIIGDEILSGKRQDKHFEYLKKTLKKYGLSLSWVKYIQDDSKDIIQSIRQSIKSNTIVFSFGGIGATPDDFTRQAAADAFELHLTRNDEAVKLIEEQFGEGAYPKRVLMADIPKGALLIPNEINKIPGFKINGHHFLPGFPEMAWPMVEWILNTHYKELLNQNDFAEASVWINDVSESKLIDLMNEIVKKYPEIKLFSLPKLEPMKTIELGVKGPSKLVAEAMLEIQVKIVNLGYEWHK